MILMITIIIMIVDPFVVSFCWWIFDANYAYGTIVVCEFIDNNEQKDKSWLEKKNLNVLCFK